MNVLKILFSASKLLKRPQSTEILRANIRKTKKLRTPEQQLDHQINMTDKIVAHQNFLASKSNLFNLLKTSAVAGKIHPLDIAAIRNAVSLESRNNKFYTECEKILKRINGLSDPKLLDTELQNLEKLFKQNNLLWNKPLPQPSVPQAAVKSATTGSLICPSHKPLMDVLRPAAKGLKATVEYLPTKGSSKHGAAQIIVTYQDGTKKIKNLGDHDYLKKESYIKDILRDISLNPNEGSLLRQARQLGRFQ